MTDLLLPEPRGRPLWLTTLADLGLLLVGFFVFLQANQHLDHRALARGLRAGFGAATTAMPVPAPPPPPMPVASATMLDFAPGSSVSASDPAALIAWARTIARDPRIGFTVTGATDGSAGDVDAATGSAVLLAGDRARSVAAALLRTHAIAPDRLRIATATPSNGTRGVTVTLGFAGARPDLAARQPDPAASRTQP